MGNCQKWGWQGLFVRRQNNLRVGLPDNGNPTQSLNKKSSNAPINEVKISLNGRQEFPELGASLNVEARSAKPPG